MPDGMIAMHLPRWSDRQKGSLDHKLLLMALGRSAGSTVDLLCDDGRLTVQYHVQRTMCVEPKILVRAYSE
jgi:hypothetical protein